MNMTELALAYRRMGWSVVPCHVPIRGRCSCGEIECSWPGKHPRVSWREFSTRRPSERELTEWFDNEFYGSNIGVVTGPISSLAVVDIDGEPAMADRLGLTKDTLTSLSGSGGIHRFYRIDEDIRSKPKIVDGVDFKSAGGFIVLPPSKHVSGGRYQWTKKVRPALLELEQIEHFLGTAQNGVNGHGWYSEYLDGVEKGDRSNIAAKLAGRYVRAGLSPKEVWFTLSKWNELNSPPLKPHELEATISWAVKKHEDSYGAEIQTRADLIRAITGEE